MSGMTIVSNQEKIDFLSQAIQLSQDLLSDILLEIQSMEGYTKDREVTWNFRFTKISKDITQFVEITSLSAKLIGHHFKRDIPAIKESHIHLLFIMKAINHALSKADHLVLDDLIKYELKDNLTQWKIDLIPQMKRSVLI